MEPTSLIIISFKWPSRWKILRKMTENKKRPRHDWCDHFLHMFSFLCFAQMYKSDSVRWPSICIFKHAHAPAAAQAQWKRKDVGGGLFYTWWLVYSSWGVAYYPAYKYSCKTIFKFSGDRFHRWARPCRSWTDIKVYQAWRRWWKIP